MPKEVSKLIEDKSHDDEYWLEEQVHKESFHKEEKEKTIDDSIFNKKGFHVLEEIIEEGPTDFLAQDLVETCHRVNSLCAMIAEKYDLNDEEYVDKEDSHEVHHVEDPVESSQAFILPTHEDEEMVSCSHTYGFMKEPLDVIGEHIYDFIHVGRCTWDVGCSSFDGDPIYDIEGGFRVKNDKLFPSEFLST
jgi:hypothetical protein